MGFSAFSSAGRHDMYNKTIKRRIDKFLGYEYFLDSEHPLSNAQGKVYYHRHIASLKIGRWLDKGEVVHHIDGNKLNNATDNLEIMSQSDHARNHLLKRDPIPCEYCKKPTLNKKFCCPTCSYIARRVVTRPSKIQLAKDIESMSMCMVGRKYGVSDNTVRKWLKQKGLI